MVAEEDVARNLAEFLLRQGGSLTASQMPKFYATMPEAKAILSAGIKLFCSKHPHILEFETDNGAGVVRVVSRTVELSQQSATLLPQMNGPPNLLLQMLLRNDEGVSCEAIVQHFPDVHDTIEAAGGPSSYCKLHSDVLFCKMSQVYASSTLKHLQELVLTNLKKAGGESHTGSFLAHIYKANVAYKKILKSIGGGNGLVEVIGPDRIVHVKVPAGPNKGSAQVLALVEKDDLAEAHRMNPSARAEHKGGILALQSSGFVDHGSWQGENAPFASSSSSQRASDHISGMLSDTSWMQALHTAQQVITGRSKQLREIENKLCIEANRLANLERQLTDRRLDLDRREIALLDGELHLKQAQLQRHFELHRELVPTEPQISPFDAEAIQASYSGLQHPPLGEDGWEQFVDQSSERRWWYHQTTGRWFYEGDEAMRERVPL